MTYHRSKQPGHRRRHRRGFAAVLAMIYLTLMASLAVGFYATVNTAVRVAHNEREIARAVAGAESMMQFVRYHMAQLNISRADQNSTTATYNAVWDQLSGSLSGTANMPVDPTQVALTKTIFIPGRDAGGAVEYMQLDDDGAVEGYAILQHDNGVVFQLKAVGVFNRGKPNEVRRAIRMGFAPATKPSAIFNFGVASKSPISMNSNARIVGANGLTQNGSVLVASDSMDAPITMDSNSVISGDFSWTNAAANPVFKNGTVAGFQPNHPKFAEHIHPGAPEPEFPEIDTGIFKKLITDNVITPTYVTPVPGGETKFDSGVMKNVYIRANSTSNPGRVVFDSNMEVQGLVYIEQPNNVRFDSNVKVTGLIVVDNTMVGAPSNGTNANNTIEFRSNTTLAGPQNLPATSDFPPELRQLTGAAILAPNFNLHFNSNFGSVGGTIVGSRLHFDSNASGTITGSVINLGQNTSVGFNSNAEVRIESTGTSAYPPGIYFSSRYVPLPDNYMEVAP